MLLEGQDDVDEVTEEENLCRRKEAEQTQSRVQRGYATSIWV